MANKSNRKGTKVVKDNHKSDNINSNEANETIPKVKRTPRGKTPKEVRLDGIMTPMAKTNVRAGEELKLFKKFAEASIQGFGIGTFDGKIIYINPALYKIAGASDPSELIGRNFIDLYPPSLQKKIKREIIPALKKGGQWHGDMEFTGVDGRPIVSHESYFSIFNDLGNPQYLGVVISDITKSRETENALRMSIKEAARKQEILLSLNQAAQVIQKARTKEEIFKILGQELGKLGFEILIFKSGEDPSELILEFMIFNPIISAAVEKITGVKARGLRFKYSPAGQYGRILKSGISQLFHSIIDPLADSLPGKSKKKAKQILKILSLYQCIFAPLRIGKRPYGILVVAADKMCKNDIPAITTFANQTAIALENSRLLEKVKQESESRYRDLVESVLDGIIIHKNGIIEFANSSMGQMTGFDVEEVLGKPLLEYISPEYHELVLQRYTARLAGKKVPSSYEITLIKKNGTLLPVETNAVIVDYQGEPAILASIRDITERKKAEESERQERARAQKYLDVAGVMIVALNNKGQVSLINKKGCEILGYQEEEILGKNWFNNFLPKKWAQSVKSGFFEIMRSGVQTKEYHENSILTKNRAEKWIAWHNITLRNNAGDITGTLSSGDDITDRRRAEMALKESEGKFKKLFEFAPTGYYLNDLKGIFVDGNRNAEEITGYRRDELMGKNFLKLGLLPPSQLPKAAGLLVKNALGKSTGPDEFTIIRKDGSQKDVVIQTYPVKIHDRKLVLGSVWDISQRKKMERELDEYRRNLEKMIEQRTNDLQKALKDSEDNRIRIDTILKSVAEGLIVTDINHHLILMNSVAEDWLGLRFSQVVNQTIDKVIDDKKLVAGIKLALSEKSKGNRFDIDRKNVKTGQNLIIEVRSMVIVDRRGQQNGVLTTLRDMTHEREIDRMKTDFISTAAHELRTPLTSIRGFSEILQTRKDLKKQEKIKFLNYINKQSVILGKIINDLLDISRIQSRIGFVLNREKFNCGDLIKEIIPTFESISPGIRFKISLPEKPVLVYADGEKMQQVLINLLSNAIKYSPEGGDIHIRGKVSMNWYTVSVEDQGIGMTRDQINKIFDKFYRADSVALTADGIGLGMSIVKQIIIAHGGRIKVESEPGQGTKVTYSIPLGLRNKEKLKKTSNKKNNKIAEDSYE